MVYGHAAPIGVPRRGNALKARQGETQRLAFRHLELLLEQHIDIRCATQQRQTFLFRQTGTVQLTNPDQRSGVGVHITGE
jgi:hypothetical protein